MIVAQHDSEDIALEWSTHSTIEIMLNTALIEDKSVWLNRLMGCKYEYEGQEIIEELKQYLPIIGFHIIPMSQKDIMKATRLRVERDNFQEQRWKES